MEFGDSVWYAKRINEQPAESATYGKPVEVKTRPNFFTVMPAEAGGYLQYIKHGETLFETWNACVNTRLFGNIINEGDLLWVDGHKPNEYLEQKYGNGASANAKVDSISRGRLSTVITLKRNHHQVIE